MRYLRAILATLRAMVMVRGLQSQLSDAHANLAEAHYANLDLSKIHTAVNAGLVEALEELESTKTKLDAATGRLAAMEPIWNDLCGYTEFSNGSLRSLARRAVKVAA